MAKVPLPSKPTPWADLIAFLGILALAGVLVVVGHVAVASLGTVCVALGGLYGVWRHFRNSK